MSSQGASVLFDAPGPKARRNQMLVGGLLTLLAVAFGVWVLWQFAAKGEFSAAKWESFAKPEEWTDYILPGLVATLEAAAASIVLAGIFGLIFGMLRLADNAVVRWVAGAVVEIFRAIPVLVMMIAFFNIYLRNGLFPGQEAFVGVVTALTLYNGSVIAELVRSGVNNLPKGQREAGLSVGLTPGQTLRTILLPQALTAMLPSIMSQLVVVLKDSALGYAITYAELVNAASTAGSWGANVLQQLIVVALIFIAINFTLTSLAQLVERRLRRRGHTAGLAPAADGVAEPLDPAVGPAAAPLDGTGTRHP